MTAQKLFLPVLASLVVASCAALVHAEALPTTTAPEQTKSPEELRKEWDATPLDRATPKGFLRSLVKAVVDQDEKAVRSMLYVSKPENKQYLDILPAILLNRQSLRKIAVARFGDKDLEKTINDIGAYGLADDIEAQFVSLQLVAKPDGSFTTDVVPLHRDDKNIYSIDLDAVPSDPQVAKSLTQMGDLSKALEKILTDNPKMTLPEFAEAAKKQFAAFQAANSPEAPQPAPATQK